MMARLVVLVAALALQAASTSAQTATPDRARTLDVARALMKKAGFCALITIGADGQPQSRIMQPRPPDPGFVVWIGTNPLTRKVREIEKDPRVTLSYFDPAGPGYVTLIGRAAIVRDTGERAKQWTDDWSSFYKDRYRGDDFVLVKVTPLRLEVVSAKDGIVNDSKTWKPVTVEFRR